MNIIRSQYLKFMKSVVRQALRDCTPEKQDLAESAIRRYSASLTNDYKIMWEETEFIMKMMLYDIDSVKTKLNANIISLQKEVDNIQRIHSSHNE